MEQMPPTLLLPLIGIIIAGTFKFTAALIQANATTKLRKAIKKAIETYKSKK